MCPDRQLISLYLDGEIPSPWKEKMETHLSNCPQCRAILAGYQNLGESLREFPAGTVEAAQERVWKKLAAQEEPRRNTVYRRTIKRVWNQCIILPLPAAAAAAVIIIVAFFALIGLRAERPAISQESIAAVNIGFDDYSMVPVQDMNDVLRYLSSQDNGDFMVIRLPEHKKFSRSGDPALINAADYSRVRRSFPR